AFGTPTDTQNPAGAWVLGAPEALIDALNLDEATKTTLYARAEQLSSSVKRTMLLAHSQTPSKTASAAHPWFGDDAVLPTDLSPAAVVTFEEKVRGDARETLEFFQQQGVELKVISGDSPHTVAAVARQIGWDHAETGYDARHLPTHIEDMAGGLIHRCSHVFEIRGEATCSVARFGVVPAMWAGTGCDRTWDGGGDDSQVGA